MPIKSLLALNSLTAMRLLKNKANNKIEKKIKVEQKFEYYKERSYGIFSNSIKNEKLHNKIEEIRNIIKGS